MDQIGALVIGAGVVGLAVARALARSGLETIVVEAQPAIGTGVSARNSEVIHAGLYYAPGSLKARLCVRGNALLYAYCAEHGVAHARCGKLVVATQASQHAALVELARTAAANGVPVQPLSAAEAMALEPELHCTSALMSPSTGIVDSHGLMLALQGDIERDGGAVALQSKVVSVRVHGGAPAVVQVDSPSGGFELAAGIVVNAAGLHACSVARLMHGTRGTHGTQGTHGTLGTLGTHGLAPQHIPHERFAKGSYFTLAGRSPFTRLVYPAPDGAWLGVHLTLDLAGQARFGPDLEWLADGTDPEAIDYRVDPQRAPTFEQAIRRYWPGLRSGALQPAYSGVRPKIHAPGEPAPDFRIDGPAVHGVPGLVNLFGIESPGLTSALAIGEHVAGLLCGVVSGVIGGVIGSGVIGDRRVP